MFKFFKEFLEFKKMKKQREMSCKRFVLSQAMIRFYQDLQTSKGIIDLPPFVYATNAMSAIKTDRDLNRLYKKFEMAGLL